MPIHNNLAAVDDSTLEWDNGRIRQKDNGTTTDKLADDAMAGEVPILREKSPPAIVKVISCDDATEWTASTGSPTIADNSTYFAAGDKGKSVQVTIPDGVTEGWIRQDIAAMDLTDSWIIVDFWIPAAEVAKIAYFTVYLWVQATSRYISHTIWKNQATPHEVNSGHYRMAFPVGDIVAGDSNADWDKSATAPDLTIIDRIAVKVDKEAAAGSGYMVIKSLRFVKKPAKSVLCFTVDNGTTANIDCLCDLLEHNVPATLYIRTHLMNTTGYLTTAQIRTLRFAGHFIANHGHQSVPQWAEVPLLADRRKIVTDGIRFFRENSLGGGARHFCTPGGGVWMNDGQDIDELIGRELSSIRAAGSYYGFYCYIMHPSMLPVLFPGYNLYNASGLSLNQRHMKHCLAHGGIHVVYCHGRYNNADEKAAIQGFLADCDGDGNSIISQISAGNLVATTVDKLGEIDF